MQVLNYGENFVRGLMIYTNSNMHQIIPSLEMRSESVI